VYDLFDITDCSVDDGFGFGFDPYESSWSDVVGSGMGAGFDFTDTDIGAISDQWSQDFAYDQHSTQATWASDGIDRSITDDPSEWDPAYGPQVDSYYTPYQSSVGYSSYDTSFIEPASWAGSSSMISDYSDPGL